MQRLEVSGLVRPLYASLGIEGLNMFRPFGDQSRSDDGGDAVMDGVGTANSVLLYTR